METFTWEGHSQELQENELTARLQSRPSRTDLPRRITRKGRAAQPRSCSRSRKRGGKKKNALLSIARGKQASCDLPVVQRESQTPAGGLRRGRSSVRVPFIYSSRLDAFRFYTRLNLLSPGRRNTGSPAAPQPPPGPSPEPDPRGRPWAAPGPRGAPRSTARGQPRRKPSSSRRVAPGRHRHHGVGCRRPAPLLVKRGESRPSAPGRSTETGLPSSPLSPQVPRHSAVRPADAPAPTRPRTRADPETTRRSPPAPRPAAPGSTAAIRAAPAAPGRAPLGRGGGGTSGGAGLPEGAVLTGGNGRGLWFGGVVKGLGRGLRVEAGLCARGKWIPAWRAHRGWKQRHLRLALMELFGLEGTLKGHLVQLPSSE